MKILTGISLLLLAGQLAIAQELTAPEIIKAANDLLNPETMWAKSKMIIQTSSGNERSFVYESWSKNHGEKNLIRYLEPARVKNQATLLLNHADDIWMYFPSTHRVRKLASHAKKQKMEGSDFSYEDMGAGDSFIDDYQPELLNGKTIQGQPCFQVELTKKENTDISYSRLIMWIRKDNFVPLRIEYYDDEHPDRLIKTLVQSDIRNIQGIPTAMQFMMINEIDNSETRMELLDVKYNLDIDDTLFTERGLKQ